MFDQMARKARSRPGAQPGEAQGTVVSLDRHRAQSRRTAGERATGRTVSGIQRATEAAEATAAQALDRALHARTPEVRAKAAREGLSGHPDPDTQALLLRQLYLGELERGALDHAYEAACQAISLRGPQDPMIDVAHHDAARACQARAAWDRAVEHLRQAIAASPPERRLLHLSTLASLLHAVGRSAEAIAPLEQALEAPGTLEPLLRAQLVLAHHATGKSRDSELDLAFHELSQDSSGEGYGRFVLGELASRMGDRVRARLHLEAFLGKVRKSRPAAQAALAAEVACATATLGKSVWN